jgi:hypothetical protein
MDRHARTLKKFINLSAVKKQLKPAVLSRERGVDGFFLDVGDSNLSPQELAAKAIEYLCEPECNDFDVVLCWAIVGFLDEEIGKPLGLGRAQQFSKLKELISEQHPYESCLNWVLAWYP